MVAFACRLAEEEIKLERAYDDLRTKKLKEETDIFVIHDFEEEINKSKKPKLIQETLRSEKTKPNQEIS